MLDLFRHDTTPQDIASALRAQRARILCDTQPAYLQAVDFVFEITEPLLRDVPAARRFMSYHWSFGDGTRSPPDVDHCRHFFQRPARLSSLWTKPDPRQWPNLSGRTHKIAVDVTVPLVVDGSFSFEINVTTHDRQAVSVTRWTGWISFGVTAGVAVVTAFSTKYATSVPNVVGWADCLTAFLLGFGLDQLRATISSPPVVTPLLPSAVTARAAGPLAPDNRVSATN